MLKTNGRIDTFWRVIMTSVETYGTKGPFQSYCENGIKFCCEQFTFGPAIATAQPADRILK